MAVQLRTARGRADPFQHGSDFHQLGRFFLDRGQGHVEARERSMSAVESSTSPMSPGVMNHSMGPPPPSLSTHRFKRHSGLNQPKLIIPQQSISEESLNNSPGAEMQPLRSVESLFGLCTSWTLILFAIARTFVPPKAPS